MSDKLGQNINQNDIYKIIDLYFSKKSCEPSILYNHLHFSYDALIMHIIPSLVKRNKLITQKLEDKIIIYYLKISNINVRLPCDEWEGNYIIPDIARKRKLTYSITLFGDFILEKEIINTENLEKISEDILLMKQSIVCKIPCMVKSKFCTLNKLVDKQSTECAFDDGGYFILSGSEKVIMSVECPVYNKILYNKKDEKYEIFIYCQQNDISKIISFHIYLDSKTQQLFVYSRTLFKEPIPIMIFLKSLEYFNNDEELLNALNVKKDNRIKNIITLNFISLYDNEEINIIDFVYKNIPHLKSDDLTNNISLEEKKKKIRLQLNETLLNCRDIHDKVYYITYMTKLLLINFFNNETIFSNKDEYTNKRFDLPGYLIAQLFKQQFTLVLRSMGFKFQLNGYNYNKLILDYKYSSIDNYILTALKTGTWGTFTKNRKGISRLLERLSYVKCFSSLRDIIVTSNDDGAKKNIAMRSVEPSQTGFVCIVSTPEGEKVGINKSLSMICTITNYDPVSPTIIELFLEKEKKNFNLVQPIEYENKYHEYYILLFLNGTLLYFIHPNKAVKLYENLKKLKLYQKIHKHTSIIFDNIRREIHINTQKGRLVRPVLRVNKENMDLILTKEVDLDKKNIHEFMLCYPETIEYIDVMEQQFSLIADKLSTLQQEKEKIKKLQELQKNKNKKISKNLKKNIYEFTFVQYDYVEFHPSLLVSIGSATIPFLSQNQSPRNTYHTVHTKQSIAIYNTNYKHRFENSNILHNPQLPLVIPRNISYFNLDKIPNGQNIILAIMSYSGFNQEDSIIMNKSSIESGMFHCVSYKDFESAISKNHFSAIDDIFLKPEQDMFDIKNRNNYNTVENDGLPLLETKISKYDCIIGKVAPITISSDMSKNKYKDKSVIYKDSYECKVDNLQSIVNSDGYHMINVKLRHHRIPIIGDKYTSRHGQKSTCGIIIDKSELPVTREGVTPDIIINPHAIPSRMTIGQIMEMITGKYGAITGTFIDGTPFEQIDMEKIKKVLRKNNYGEDGMETMYCGITGEKYESPIFIAPCYYIKLKQLVADKIHARSIGPINNVTRQPPQGKSRNGGTRIGEMEKDCFVAHGISTFLRERMVDCSDKYQVHVCNKCGLFASKVKNHDNQFWCKACNSYNDIYEIKIPYALKLVMQELRSINIGMNLNLKK